MRALALLLQAATTTPQTTDRPAADRLAVTAQHCAGPSETGEVVVCARREDEQRLKPLLPLPVREKPDPLAFRLPGGGKARVRAIQTELPGATGQGAAITVSIPLGRKKRR